MCRIVYRPVSLGGLRQASGSFRQDMTVSENPPAPAKGDSRSHGGFGLLVFMRSFAK